jgi:hypothetical protein
LFFSEIKTENKTEVAKAIKKHVWK